MTPAMTLVAAARHPRAPSAGVLPTAESPPRDAPKRPAETIRTAKAALEGERKPVTVPFADVEESGIGMVAGGALFGAPCEEVELRAE